jgi:hypothetical protein
MSSRAWYCLLLVLLMAGGCRPSARPAASRFCGDSFCLDGIDPNAVRVSSPTGDFKLYKVVSGGHVFYVFEGNAPREPGALVRRVTLRIPAASATLFRRSDQIEIYVVRASAFAPPVPPPIDAPTPPADYLHIFTRCPMTQECGIEAFAQRLVSRESRRER